MRLEIGIDGLRIIAESDQDRAYFRDTLRLRMLGEAVPLMLERYLTSPLDGDCGERLETGDTVLTRDRERVWRPRDEHPADRATVMPEATETGRGARG